MRANRSSTRRSKFWPSFGLRTMLSFGLVVRHTRCCVDNAVEHVRVESVDALRSHLGCAFLDDASYPKFQGAGHFPGWFSEPEKELVWDSSTHPLTHRSSH